MANVLTEKDLGRAVADFDKCGGGRGAQCCVWLMLGKDGFSCERWGPLHQTAIAHSKQWTSKRMPVQPFPDCQLSPASLEDKT